MRASVKTACPWGTPFAVVVAAASILIGCESTETIRVPYDNSNPVVYDNDETIDMYTDEYLMALASSGEIHLVGIVTSSAIAPYNPDVTSAEYQQMAREREAMARLARTSGFRHIPNPVRGVAGSLQKPTSGRIEDTNPIGSEGSRLIVKEARKASPERPLVVVEGGPLTTIADAYLLDPTIADKVVVAWLGGRLEGGVDDMGDYNGWSDGWAAYVVLEKLRLVQFPFRRYAPSVPKAKLLELPASPLRDWMVQKHHPTNDLPGEYDEDGPPAISISRPDYPLNVQRVSFSHWVTVHYLEPHQVPALRVNRDGKALRVATANRALATEEWWRALKHATAQNRKVTATGVGHGESTGPGRRGTVLTVEANTKGSK